MIFKVLGREVKRCYREMTHKQRERARESERARERESESDLQGDT